MARGAIGVRPRVLLFLALATFAPTSLLAKPIAQGLPGVPGGRACVVNKDCEDGSDCTIDTCVDQTCQVSLRPNGVACADDGNDCTRDICNGAGICNHPIRSPGSLCGTPVLNECDLPDVCDELGVCQINFAPTGTACGRIPGACFADLCNGSGACETQLFSGPCDDANACTVSDTCQGEVCAGTAVDCTGAGDVCNVASCLNTGIEGNCDLVLPLDAGTLCDDGVFCNGLDACNGNGTCAIALPPCSAEEFCVEDKDVCLVGIDCNVNGVPDRCDLACGLPGEECYTFAECGQGSDCNKNGIPDECDLTACPQLANCDDCNQNGVPDSCDIASGVSLDTNPSDGIPDECAGPLPGQHAWTDDVWNLAGGYPGNVNGVPDLFVTMSMVQMFLDETVEIEGLRIRSGAVLEVTQVAQGDLTINPANSGGIINDGTIIIGDGRSIDARGGRFSLGEGGLFIADPLAGGAVSASLTTGSLTVRPTLCGAAEQMTLRSAMSITTLGDLTLDSQGVSPCPCNPNLCADGSGNSVFAQGGRTLPIFRHFSIAASASRAPAGPTVPAALVVRGSFRILVGATVKVGPEGPSTIAPVSLQLDGDFDNQSVYPSLFDWDQGDLILTSQPTASRFEVAGIDLGSTLEGFDTDADARLDRNRHLNFGMGTIRVVAGGDVTFVNAFANTIGTEPCEEALYVHDLSLGTGAQITLDNCRVYFERRVDEGAQIDSLGCGALVQLATGDANADRRVDVLDLPDFVTCLLGPDIAMVDPTCAVFDFDVDGDVDVRDAGTWTTIFTLP